MNSIAIDQCHWEEMLSHIESTAPIEACGFLAGIGQTSRGVFPVSNTLQSTTRYRMAEGEMVHTIHTILEKGWDIFAIYHSHPHGPAVPSSTDISEATFPESVQLIWGQEYRKWIVKAYKYHPIDLPEEISISIIKK